MKSKPKNEKHNNRGRKSAWETIIQPQLDRIVPLRRQGLTEEQVAKVLGIGYGTLRENKTEHPEFARALKKGKEVLIEELEASLYKIALGGYEVKTTKKYIEQGAEGKQKTKIEETSTIAQPNCGALVFSLKNLAPDKWKDVRIDTDMTALNKALENSKTVFEKMQEAIKSEEDK